MLTRLCCTAALVTGICLFSISSCSQKTPKTLPVIDVIGAFDRTRTLLLTDIVESVEYVKLETTPECLLGEGISVKIADRLYIHNAKTKQILVFDRSGKFIGPIGSQGQGPGEYLNFAHFDVSQDGRLLALGGFGEIYFYSTEGKFLRRTGMADVFPFLSGFLFLDPDHLATHQVRMNFSQEAFPMMLLWDAKTLQADTILRQDLTSLESDLPISFTYTSFYPYSGAISLMEAANDTLYELNRDRKISPRLFFDCGDLALKEENLFKTGGKASIKIYPACETSKFLLFGASKGDDYCLMAYNKKSGETFRLPERISNLDGKSVLYGPENDLDGVDLSFNGSKINDGAWCSALQIADLKDFFNSYRSVETHNYASLRQLTEASDLYDNPIIRIIHWK